MSWTYQVEINESYGCQESVSRGGISKDILRKYAEEFLGPHRSIHDLDPREQEVLIAEIEADILGLDERLQIVPHTDYQKH